ncbi:hypothetical protein Cva_00668 [Caedimonas varicaedens]|uniref:Uncharacterized protein n=1 Tax=Caedimonas varicaedens TaxID=1629334 RepID=A0A0K8MBX1_9PROT|nr:hypothetical protein Cva_00668 [Caedimonas varicaedens]
MDVKPDSAEHTIRKEIAKAIFKNEGETLLSYPYSSQTIRAVAKAVNLSEEDARASLRDLILDLWYDDLFKYFEGFLDGKHELWTGVESAEVDDVIPDSIFIPWLKENVQNCLTKFEKYYGKLNSQQIKSTL